MRFIAVPAAFVLVACGGQVRDDDATKAPAPAPASSAPPAVPTTEVAIVTLFSSSGSLYANAQFGVPMSPSTPDGCALEGAVGVADGRGANAGTIRVGPADDPSAIVLAYDSTNRRYTPASVDRGVGEGASVAVASDGSDAVPPFHIGLTIGAAPELTEPVAGAVVGDDDIPVTWRPVDDGALFFVSLGVGRGRFIGCHFDGRLGHAVVPAALVRAAATDPTACTGDCTFLEGGFMRTTTGTSGPYAIDVVHITTTLRLLATKP